VAADVSLHAGQPWVAGNDWTSLSPGPLGGLRPTRTVSVVIPAHQSAGTLSYALAALSVQTYPEELVEVVVVDDGSSPPVTLPDLRPARTRVTNTSRSWGPAEARHVGALAAEGDVLHWLDADMLLERDEIEAQMRWHHLVSYAVVLGTKTFVDVTEALPGPDVVAEAVREGRTAELFAGRWTSPHQWVEEHLERTHGLTDNPTSSYLVHVGASASVGRDVYLETGGMDPALKASEDIELGYRLAQQGAVFVPDAEARAWHLGRSTLMESQEAVNRYNRPFVTDRVPDLRHWRTKGRSYTVPWVEVVVDARGHTYEEVRHSVNGALTGTVADVHAVVVGPWSRLSDTRHRLLEDQDRDLRMVRAELVGDSRVRFAEELPATAFPAPYRLLLPAGWSPGPDTVRRLAREMSRKDRGLVSLLLPDGQVSRLERTSAFHRAARLTEEQGQLDAVVDQVSRTWWYDAVEEGFHHVASQGAADGPPAAAKPTGETKAAAGRNRGGAARRTDLPATDAGATADDQAGDAAKDPARDPGDETGARPVRDLLGRAVHRRRPPRRR
jgi:glycosyltransferase involved in cell wall biosynthesis